LADADVQELPGAPSPATGAAPFAERAGRSLELAFLLVALALLVFSHRAPATRTLSLLFASIVLEALPFMLVGALVGGLVETFVRRERVVALLPGRTWPAVLVAAGLGLALPVCECAVVPVVRRLARKGLPLPVAVAYLLGAPVANPIVALSTAVAYQLDWRVVLARTLLGYGIAVAVGLAAGRLFRGREAFHPSIAAHEAGGHPGGCCHTPGAGEHPTRWGRLGEALRHAGDDFVGVGKYFVVGAFVAAAAQTFVDRSLLAQVASQPVLAIVLMMGLAVALNLCSEADAFVASSFRGLVPLSAQLAFLLLGPILDLKLLLMYQTLFRRRVILALAAGMVLAVLGVALALHASGGFP
jgi:uncharacterized protein